MVVACKIVVKMHEDDAIGLETDYCSVGTLAYGLGEKRSSAWVRRLRPKSLNVADRPVDRWDSRLFDAQKHFLQTVSQTKSEVGHLAYPAVLLGRSMQWR